MVSCPRSRRSAKWTWVSSFGLAETGTSTSAVPFTRFSASSRPSGMVDMPASVWLSRACWVTRTSPAGTVYVPEHVPTWTVTSNTSPTEGVTVYVNGPSTFGSAPPPSRGAASLQTSTKPVCGGGTGSSSTSSVLAPPAIATVAVPAVRSKSSRLVVGTASNQAIATPVGTSSRTVTRVPVANVPSSRHDQVDGSSSAELASVLTSGPPLTLKLNRFPQYAGVSLSL